MFVENSYSFVISVVGVLFCKIFFYIWSMRGGEETKGKRKGEEKERRREGKGEERRGKRKERKRKEKIPATFMQELLFYHFFLSSIFF